MTVTDGTKEPLVQKSVKFLRSQMFFLLTGLSIHYLLVFPFSVVISSHWAEKAQVISIELRNMKKTKNLYGVYFFVFVRDDRRR